MRFTDCSPPSRSTSTPRWRTTSWTSSSTRAQTPAASRPIFHALPSSAPPPAPAERLGHEPRPLEHGHEPYFIMQGYRKRTPQGRVAVPLTYRKLGIAAPKRTGELFD